jgi:hypothetical protein
MMNGVASKRLVRHVATSVGSSVATLGASWVDGDLVIGFTMNSTANARPITCPSGTQTTIAGATSPSATSAGNAGWFVAKAADTSVDAPDGTATRFAAAVFRGAKLFKGAMLVATNSTITIPAVKGLRHGGIVFVMIQSETASLTISTDNMGVDFGSSNTTGTTRHRWTSTSAQPSYAGGNVILSGSGEFWAVYGIIY